jgi:hypothetical protein
MTRPPAGDPPGQEALLALAGRLEAYAAALPEHDQQLLKVLLLRAMDPVDRIGLRDVDSVLDAREAAYLDTLAPHEPHG